MATGGYVFSPHIYLLHYTCSYCMHAVQLLSLTGKEWFTQEMDLDWSRNSVIDPIPFKTTG